MVFGDFLDGEDETDAFESVGGEADGGGVLVYPGNRFLYNAVVELLACIANANSCCNDNHKIGKNMCFCENLNFSNPAKQRENHKLP